MYRLGSAVILAAVAVLFVAGEATSQVRDRYDNSIDMRAPEGANRTTGPSHPTVTQSDTDKRAYCPASGCGAGASPGAVQGARPTSPDLPPNRDLAVPPAATIRP